MNEYPNDGIENPSELHYLIAHLAVVFGSTGIVATVVAPTAGMGMIAASIVIIGEVLTEF